MRSLKLYNKLLQESYKSINEIINNLSDNVKNSLINNEIIDDNNQINVNKTRGIINKTNNAFDEAFNQVISLEDINNLGQLFIQTVLPKYVNILDNGQNIFFKLLQEVGCNRLENPYFDFIKNYNKDLSNENWVVLNNIYANDVVDENTIRGQGEDGLNHIIFDKKLWESDSAPSEKDKYDLINIWEKLGDERFVNKLNINDKTVTNTQLRNILSAEQKSNIKDFRKDVIYTQNGIRDINLIKKLLVNMQSGIKDTNIQTSKDLAKDLDTKGKQLGGKDLQSIVDNWRKIGLIK